MTSPTPRVTKGLLFGRFAVGTLPATVIASNGEIGALHGMFHFLR